MSCNRRWRLPRMSAGVRLQTPVATLCAVLARAECIAAQCAALGDALLVACADLFDDFGASLQDYRAAIAAQLRVWARWDEP